MDTVDRLNDTTNFVLEDLTLKSALQVTFSKCREHNTLKKGATEVTKCLIRVTSEDDPNKPELVVLAKDLNEDFQKIIVNRCEVLKVPIIYMDDRKTLASILPVKSAKNTGAVCITKYIDNSRERAFIVNACSSA